MYYIKIDAANLWNYLTQIDKLCHFFEKIKQNLRGLTIIPKIYYKVLHRSQKGWPKYKHTKNTQPKTYHKALN